MILWVLIISIGMSTTVAFRDKEDCVEAAAKLKVPAMCVAFAADVSTDGKKL